MKKLTALLMALVLTAAMMTSAMAYEPVKPTNDQLAITHTLTLSAPELTSLSYDIEYSFAVSSTATVVQPTDITNVAKAVTGAPSIANIKYTPEDTFSTSNKSCIKELQIDWSGVEIKEPGVYRWEVTKSVTDTDTNEDPSNNSGTTYLYVYAIDNGGTLTINSVGLTSKVDLNDASTKGNMSDSYPAKTLDLSISKTVTGNQGSKDQYFKFTVSLTSPNGATNRTYTISGHDVDVPPTAYHEGKTNVTTITVNSGSPSSVELWLKHGQTVTIEDLIFGTSYTVTESENTGYTVQSVITGDVTDAIVEEATARDTSLEVSSTVAYTNKKEATVPAGIVLESGAPIFGVLLAMGLMIVMFIGKRREEAA